VPEKRFEEKDLGLKNFSDAPGGHVIPFTTIKDPRPKAEDQEETI